MKEIGNRRTFQLEMRIEGNRVARYPSHEARTNIHAAGEGDLAVDDEDFTVGAQIGVRQAQPDDDIAVEHIDRDALVFQELHDARKGIARTDRIDR